jgi:hypothetical protein
VRFTTAAPSTTPAGTVGRSRTSARIGLAGLAGMATFAGAALVAGLRQPGYDPGHDMISTLAAQDATSPVVMIGCFLAAAAALLVAGVTLFGRLRSFAGRTGAGLVTLAGAGMVVAGLARQDCSQTSAACLARESAGLASTAHWTHQFSSMALFTALVVAAPLLARGLRRSSRWRHLARPMRWTAPAGLVGLVTFLSQAEGDHAGLAQRAFLLVVFSWPVWLTHATAPTGTTEPTRAGMVQPSLSAR